MILVSRGRSHAAPTELLIPIIASFYKHFTPTEFLRCGFYQQLLHAPVFSLKLSDRYDISYITLADFTRGEYPDEYNITILLEDGNNPYTAFNVKR